MMHGYAEALAIIFSFKTIVLMLAGLVAGIVAGALPGLTATMSIALLVPFTYQVDPPIAGLIMLLGVYVGAMHGGAISAILINTPGTPAAAATCLDGYPLARKGLASLAINVSTISGVVGGVFSALVLWTTAGPIAAAALKFGPFEMFCLAVFGLSVISGVSEGSAVKGLLMGAMGMLFAAAGRSPVFDVDRLTFGLKNLPESDLRYIPLMIGVFAVAEAFAQLEAMAVQVKTSIGFKNQLPDRECWRRLKVPLTVGSVIGTIVGAIPGAGGDIASFVAYDQTKKLSKRPEEFGKGAIEGLSAAECANNSVTGGAMIPMLTLGIPGDSVTAVLIGAMVVLGLRPGPTLFSDPDPNVQILVKGILVGLLVVNLVALPIGVLGSPLFARTIAIPDCRLWPLVTAFCVVGSYSMTGSMTAVYIMLAFGAFGYAMKKFGFPPGPLILGVILGPMAESNLHRALRIGDGRILAMLSPLSAALLLLALASAFAPAIQEWRRKKKAADA